MIFKDQHNISLLQKFIFCNCVLVTILISVWLMFADITHCRKICLTLKFFVGLGGIGYRDLANGHHRVLEYNQQNLVVGRW